jgi:hypothetical protein
MFIAVLMALAVAYVMLRPHPAWVGFAFPLGVLVIWGMRSWYMQR